MNRKEEIKRLPFVVSAYKQIYRSESCCGICNLPWSVCGHEHIDITDKYGVFYVCPYCWENNDLQTILKATTQGYLSQFHSCSTDEDKAHFLEEHKLVDILMKTEQKYISTHSEKTRKIKNYTNFKSSKTMKPKKFQEANVVYGEGQPEYKPLPAHKTKEGQAIFCFELDEAERKKIAETGELWVSLLTFNQPLQPIFITINKSDLFIQPDATQQTDNESSSIIK
ncbi:hypothetical protein NXX51_17660 [Bacteroides thetaiotaomicron]|nr:hypothetical protein [Bacteroides thetaiotaomicron]UVS11736.1 hypothetical protein NXX51_17660 [Bacteroides thetaiotaomicron]